MINRLLFLLIFFGGFSQVSFAEGKVVAVNVQGSVQISQNGNQQALKENNQLSSSDKILTSEKTQVDLVCNDRWVLRILPNTELLLSKLGDFETQIDLQKGEALFYVAENKVRKFEVITPTAAATVRGQTKFWGKVMPQNKLSSGVFGVREGILEVHLRALEFDVTLNEGQAVDLPTGFQFPALRELKEVEKNTMQKIDEIPTLLLKANIENELYVLNQLNDLSDSKRKP